ncbi:MAG: tRNA (adenosine(37)-N6)-dimethylallyltransferase MiaA, partial [Treponema sp.]|nr:tRNA (adenosine(37)-N6)-dimethylallyltransferase MiaA [Treponema sp.]
VDSLVRGYSFVDVPRNELLRKELSVKSLEELGGLLLRLRPNLHNRTDLLDRERTLRAIEIETFMQSQEGKALAEADRAKRKVKAFVLGLTMPRENLRQNIKIRLKERFDLGMIDEVRQLHERDGYSWERLEKLGLEYRFISQFLEGKIASFEELFETLYHAICQFAKRQETWFRGMERKGVDIHWLSRDGSKDAAYSQALDLIEKNVAFV